MFAGKIPRYTFIPSMISVPPLLVRRSPVVDIGLDPRVELLATVGYLCGYKNVNTGETPYGVAMERRFGAFRDHKAVKTFASLSSRGFSRDAPVDLVLRHSDPPELLPRAALHAGLTERFGSAARRAGAKVKPGDFVAMLRDFSDKTGFTVFFTEWAEVFRPLARKIAGYLDDGSIARVMTEYFGVEPGDFHVIPSPLLHGGYGPRIQRADGSFDLYHVCGPNYYSGRSVPDYGSKECFLAFAFHEFGHSFVNPVTERYPKDVKKLFSLFSPIRTAMTGQAYGDWFVCVNEHLVRASVVGLIRRTLGEDAARARLIEEYGRGFIYIHPLVAALERYEADRTAYPTFASFYPEILKVLADLKRNGPSAGTLPPFEGPINAAFFRPGKTVMIVPTHEVSAELRTAVRTYVEMIRKMFSLNAEILTDDKALGRDLSNRNLIVYGSPEGNSWLAGRLPRMPVKITRDGITAGQFHQGERLRFITAFPNPDNPAFALVVYTAQNGEDVPGINAVFHGPADFVVADGTAVVAAGNYRKNGKEWSFPETVNPTGI